MNSESPKHYLRESTRVEWPLKVYRQLCWWSPFQVCLSASSCFYWDPMHKCLQSYLLQNSCTHPYIFILYLKYLWLFTVIHKFNLVRIQLQAILCHSFPKCKLHLYCQELIHGAYRSQSLRYLLKCQNQFLQHQLMKLQLFWITFFSNALSRHLRLHARDVEQLVDPKLHCSLPS